MSENPEDQQGVDFLDPAEVFPLLEAMHDPRVEVRIVVFEALTRLPLTPSDWTTVGAFATWVLESSDSSQERLAVIDSAKWVPLRSIREHVRRLAREDADEEVRDRAVRAAATFDHANATVEAFEGSPLHPSWAVGKPPGFTRYSASEVARVGGELAKLDTVLADEPQADLDHWPGLDNRIMGPVLERDLAPAAVTRLFERAGGQECDIALGNNIVGWLREIQGQFRPDLDGLFAQYWRIALEECTRWNDHRRPGAWFLWFPDFEDWHGYRSLCWQIGWTVSRGGLRGLVPALAAHLTAGDGAERIAAALLIADAADYILQSEPPFFGGGRGPERRVLSEGLPEDTSPGAAWRIQGQAEDLEPAHPAEPANGGVQDARPQVEPTAAVATPGAEPSDERTPRRHDLDENVQFTVYRPQSVKPLTWATLLVFAHLSERRLDATEDEPDPVAEVQRQAQQVLGEQFGAYREVAEDSAQAVPREGELTFVPEIEGVEFNPKQRSFLWEESVHREEFRMRAAADMDGHTARGRLTVFLGTILLAEVSLSVRVDSRGGTAQLETSHAAPYRKIFPSYSHKDEAVVAQVERYAQTLGDEYLRDVTHLRSGEVWNARLEAFIRDADVFQLFWSSNSMRSPYVRQEWEYALTLSRPNFIRPTYWENPLPNSPGEDLPPEALKSLHFQHLNTAAAPAPVEAPPPAVAAPEATRPDAVPEPAPPPAPARRRMRSSFPYAAGLLVLIGAFAFTTTMYTASPAPKPVKAKKMVVRSIGFDAQSVAIRPDALPILKEYINPLTSVDLAVVIEGHTDSSEASAVDLALQRAAAVKDYLVAHGIPASRMGVEGFGDTRPVAPNETAEGRAMNRRVEFRLMNQEDFAARP